VKQPIVEIMIIEITGLKFLCKYNVESRSVGWKLLSGINSSESSGERGWFFHRASQLFLFFTDNEHGRAE
jgi:hypothetical protein